MKLIIHQNQISNHPEQFLREAGYGFIVDRQRGKQSFVRRLTRDHYPRLHMYVMPQGEKIVFDLHLDQKQASYHGSHMHNAEYDNPMVLQEIERLKEMILGNISKVKTITNFPEEVTENDIGHGSYEKNIILNKKKKWWQIF